MNTGLSRIELTGLARTGGGLSGWPEQSAVKYPRSGFVWLPIALIAAIGVWMLLSGYESKPAEGQPVGPVSAIAAEPAPSMAAATPTEFDPPTAAGEAIVPEQTAPVDRLKISSQSWRRGGLGSKALITFTLRNGNDYAVKDIEIACVFSRPDGSHLTDRSRMIHDTVDMKSRKTFARIHVGFVNINASKAKCSLLAARHS